MKARVGYLDVPIRPMPTDFEHDVECSGYWSPNSCSIMVRTDLVPAEQARVVLHELLHACWFAYQLPDDCDEETVVGRLDRALTALVRDNAGLFKDLQAALNDSKPLPLGKPKHQRETK